MEKLDDLRKWLKGGERLAVAFSGGVDSTLLVYLAHQELGDNMIALTAESPSLPLRDREEALSFVRNYHIPHQFIKTDEFENEDFRRNPENRCYHCKRELFGQLTDYALKNHFRFVLDGTNQSDLGGHRPGYRAIQESEMTRTPYIELGITKMDIREICQSLGLSVARKPASACLSSRIPRGNRIEPEDLRRVDSAEEILREMNFSQIRVRHHGELARIQGIQSEIPTLLQRRSEIGEKLKAVGYRFVTIDTLAYDDPSGETI